MTRDPLRTIALTLAALIVLASCACKLWGEVKVGKASYYSVKSCRREGTSGIMANGQPLDDEKLTCAMWGPKFGTVVKVTNLDNGKSVTVVCKDRGPGTKAWRSGVLIDLSVRAFRSIAPLRRGVVRVRVETIERGK